MTDTLIHTALQYLAAFGINYINAKTDDSHTNVAWNEGGHRFESRTTKSGQELHLELDDFSLQWVGSRALRLGLAGRSHGEVLTWLHHCAIQNGYEDFNFRLHYTLDTGRISSEDLFEELNSDRVKRLVTYRNAAQEVCLKTKEHFEFQTEIRVWPHHFDTGGYATMNDIGIGFGMAVPDTLVDDHYLYVSAYKDGKAISPTDYPKMNIGNWSSQGFNGAILALSGISPEDYPSFMKTSILEFLEREK